MSHDSLDLNLLRVLYALLTEGSVSRAAVRLNQSQPAVSTALRRLRDILGDPLLVRSRGGMTPTERGASLLEPVRNALMEIERIALQQPEFHPDNTRKAFKIASPDYLNPFFIGGVIGRVKKLAPHATLSFVSLGQEFDYADALETGDLDLVIGNWPNPPAHLRVANLFEDEIVCLVRKNHPIAARGTLTETQYLQAEHLAPTPYSVAQRGVIDTHLASRRLKRNVVATIPYFGMAPYVLIQTDLLFTASRKFAEHYARFLPLAVIPAPLDFPKVQYYQLWHDRKHYAEEYRWLRAQVSEVAKAV